MEELSSAEDSSEEELSAAELSGAGEIVSSPSEEITSGSSSNREHEQSVISRASSRAKHLFFIPDNLSLI
jgi:hypothetical protein